jgi:predicted nuclease of predicted toxin-antitoxin system
LIDASMPRSTAPLIQSRGHDAIDVRDIGLGTAKDEDIAAHARDNSLCLVSRDFDFADVRNYPPADYAGLVVLKLPNHAVAAVVLNAVENLVARGDVLNQLAGRLAIVELARIRLRPAP